MTYEAFKKKINAIIGESEKDAEVRFSNDTDAGKFIARVSDDVTIIGNSSSLKVTVRFGSGHQAMAIL